MKIKIIRDKTPAYNGGIKRHCENIYMLMNGYLDVFMYPIEDLVSYYIKIIRKFYFDKKSLSMYIQDGNCDIMHIHGFMSLGVLQSIKLSSKFNKQVIYSPHLHPFTYLNNPLLGKLFFFLLIRPLLCKIHTIVTINSEDTAFFSKYHPNVIQIPHWIESTIISEKANIRKKNMVLFVGRFDSNKGIEHLYYLSSKYEIHCVSDKNAAIANSSNSHFIYHTGLTDEELSCLYKQAAVVVIPSRYEAFSLVALEALNNGTPIVVSDRVRIVDYLHGGKGYRIFKYHDFDGFCESVDSIIGEDFNSSELLASFEESKIRRQYYELYLSAYRDGIS